MARTNRSFDDMAIVRELNRTKNFTPGSGTVGDVEISFEPPVFNGVSGATVSVVVSWTVPAEEADRLLSIGLEPGTVA